jgi:hypothetical protein
MRKTNKALIKKLTPDSVGETFLLSAVEKYCKDVLADTSDWGDRSMINKELWQVIAKHNQQLIKEHYK